MYPIPNIPTGNYDPKTRAMLYRLGQDQRRLNDAIVQYNQQKTPQNLHKLKMLREHVISVYPDSLMADSYHYYNALNVILPQEIQNEERALGINPYSSRIQQLFDTMPGQNVSQLMAILAYGQNFDKNAVINLYHPQEPGYLEWQSFLQNHSIEFLGGGNSKNFKITNINNPQQIKVLKVDNRMRQPRIQERIARQILPDVITPVHSEHLTAWQYQNGDIYTRGLLLTEYCTGGDLEKHAKQHVDTNQRLQAAADVYGQMGYIVETLRKNNLAHPDMKNTNWLIENGKVRIADSKSLIPTNNGIVDRRHLDNNYSRYISTPFVNPPEIYNQQFDADKLHVYQMGKNLYQYLTQCDWQEINKPGEQLSFSHPIFATPQGQEYAKLIINMVHSDPNQRIQMQQATQSLSNIKNMGLTAQIPGQQANPLPPTPAQQANPLPKTPAQRRAPPPVPQRKDKPTVRAPSRARGRGDMLSTLRQDVTRRINELNKHKVGDDKLLEAKIQSLLNSCQNATTHTECTNIANQVSALDKSLDQVNIKKVLKNYEPGLFGRQKPHHAKLTELINAIVEQVPLEQRAAAVSKAVANPKDYIKASTVNPNAKQQFIKDFMGAPPNKSQKQLKQHLPKPKAATPTPPRFQQ